MDAYKLSRLDAMGITVWQRRETAPGSAAPDVSAVGVEARPVASPSGPGAAHEAELEALRLEVAQCTRCALHQTRTQTVFGVGAHDARLMIIGEAPGADEDRQGEPFVGRAGRLLNSMLGAIGLEREAVYIANIVKCRPPRNRDPRPEETASCGGYLKRQIELVRPRVILAVGRVAAQNLLGTATAIGRLRGQQHRHPQSGVPLVVTYHPAYLLRSPAEKRKSWEDLKRVRRLLQEAE
ncbi:MAG: uracil-DNA glycosylase [Gammaproteobacteria bacterium]|nr:uracil-DNA glycosylase [Gammaproteobacteria bacterium]